MATQRARLSTTDPATLLPGLSLSLAVGAAAIGMEHVETALFGRAWLEALVLAILGGTIIRTLWEPNASWQPGIKFSAKTLLEIAVVLLGASVSVATIEAAGPAFLVGIAGLVAVAVCASYLIGRTLGLPTRMALLVACGNSICGNSAIAAVAPIIRARSDEVAASIAFTAILGVMVVIGLPMIGFGFGLAALPYGALAGLTVYAVPQVIAAAAPLGSTAVQIGTLAKLVRVLMLGPVCIVLSLLAPKLAPDGAAEGMAPAKRPRLSQLVPWFILGFLALMTLRAAGLLPPAILAPAARVSTSLTIISMAALGLGCDVRTVVKAGGRVIAAVTLSLILLGLMSWMLIRLLHIG